MWYKRPVGVASIVVLSWSSVYGQSNDTSTVNDTCTADSCGISTCPAGYELEVTIDSASLVISCNACAVDYFKAEESADPCEACPDGLVAEEGATVCALEEGFWRTSNTSLTAYECPNYSACVGGADEASYCDDGFEGPLCAVCSDDYYPSGSYECLECTTANSASVIITIVIFLGVLALCIVAVMKAVEKVEEHAKEQGTETDRNANDAATAALAAKGSKGRSTIFVFVKKWKDTLLVRFKVIVTHFQVIATFPAVFDVQWPESFNRYADKFSVFTLDIWGILTQGCYFRYGFLKELVFTTAVPLGIVAILVIHYWAKVRKSASSAAAKHAAWDRTAGAVLLTGFLFYIVTSTLVLKAFNCRDFDDGTSFLVADYNISCDSAKYDFIKGYAIVMVIIFPVGIPITYLAVLLRGRSRINPDPKNPEFSAMVREGDVSIQKTKFLWGTYRPAAYFYEVWECVRKLLLTGLIVYFEEGTATQVVIAILITLSGLRVLSGLRPYLREDENTLAEASLWVTFLTLFAGLLIKSDVATDDGYDTVALGVVLSIMNVALLGLAGFQILYTTSVWFRETCGCMSSETRRKNDQDKARSMERRRQSAPAAAHAAAANPLGKPRPSARPIEQLQPAHKPRAVEQPRVKEGPRSMPVPPATMERPHSTVRPQSSKVSVPTNNAIPVRETQSQPIRDPRSGQGTNGANGALPARQKEVPHVPREADQERRRASDGANAQGSSTPHHCTPAATDEPVDRGSPRARRFSAEL